MKRLLVVLCALLAAVQAIGASRVGGAGGNSGNPGSASIAITYTPAQGDSEVIEVGIPSATVSVSSISETGCTWVLDKREAANGVSEEVWHCSSVGASPGSPTINLSGSIRAAVAILTEFDTPLLSSPLDVSAVGTGTTATATMATASAGTSTQASELWLYGGFALDSNNTAHTVSSVASGWTQDANSPRSATNTSTLATNTIVVAYEIATATGTVLGSATLDSAPTNWAACVVALKFLATASPPLLPVIGVGL